MNEQEILQKMCELDDLIGSIRGLIKEKGILTQEKESLTNLVEQLKEENGRLSAGNADLVGQISKLDEINRGLRRKGDNLIAEMKITKEELRRLKKQRRSDSFAKPIQLPAGKKPKTADINVISNPVRASNGGKKGLLVFATGVKGIEHKLKKLQESCPDIVWQAKKLSGWTPRNSALLGDASIVAILSDEQKHKNTNWIRDKIQSNGGSCFTGNSIGMIANSINQSLSKVS